MRIQNLEESYQKLENDINEGVNKLVEKKDKSLSWKKKLILHKK